MVLTDANWKVSVPNSISALDETFPDEVEARVAFDVAYEEIRFGGGR